MNKQQCKKCGQFHKANECKQDFFSVYNYAKLKGIDLDNQEKSELKIGDIIILNPSNAETLYKNGIPINSKQYKEIHQKNIKGKITNLVEQRNHYCWGEYASVLWDNGYETKSIHASWLKKYE